MTTERDAIRDRGETYAKRLRGAGVPVIAVRINGTGHILYEKHGKFVNLLMTMYLRNILTHQL
uniref:Alpha/beta hydrolase fold-3 domain-containing protein n=1 Tax=Ignisphaera aggregans TaxID=334771 RepID=A0A7J2U4J8_9CREN